MSELRLPARSPCDPVSAPASDPASDPDPADVRRLLHLVRKIRSLDMDQAEYAYFKALILLRPGRHNTTII